VAGRGAPEQGERMRRIGVLVQDAAWEYPSLCWDCLRVPPQTSINSIYLNLIQTACKFVLKPGTGPKTCIPPSVDQSRVA
jgi:hypothetical protein